MSLMSAYTASGSGSTGVISSSPRSRRKSFSRWSQGKMANSALISAHMVEMLWRWGMVRLATPSPPNSMEWPVTSPYSPAMYRNTSFPVHPSGRAPWKRYRMVGATWNQVSPVQKV